MKRALGMMHENGFGDIKMALGTIHLIIINGFRVDARTERLVLHQFHFHTPRFSLLEGRFAQALHLVFRLKMRSVLDFRVF